MDKKAVDDNFVDFDDYIKDIMDETETYISFNNKPFKVNNNPQNKLPASTRKETKNDTSKPDTDGLDTLSNFLTAASLIPGLDTFTNLASIPVDLARGDFLSAGLSTLGVVPFVGEIADVSKYAKSADKAVDAAKTVNKAANTANGINSISPAKLTQTHKLTLSKKQYDSLVESIRKNGITEPVKYVEHEGTKYVVDGHHRLKAAKQLGLDKIPVQEVLLPYKGYSTIENLLWFD